ncbi:luciferase family protein [Spongiactinospora sp. TRM90649]|uniref:luciferase domain-containing protein n=1 Tax=Spongiactinospora sp. TRM90649 TaxID=3031114 RepID=UPI0023FA253C|nr:luciferase family protein [Spongiactinospora sp. TRM90649]MDF5752760.1 DUF5519 family protein [Spongiactinospora sp. TRM90649]
MAVLASAGGTASEFAAFVAAQLTAWPDLVPRRKRRRLEFRAGGVRIVRMTPDGTAELLLTESVIERMAPVLADCAQVVTGGRPGWVSIRIAGRADAELFLSLVSVAIKANAA